MTEAADQLRVKWERRDTPEPAALEARREFLALQRVERALTNQMSEAQDEQ